MILICIVAWVLLTACGEWALHEASFADAWRKREMGRGGRIARMIQCFACPWGWSSLVAGGVVALGAASYYVDPWAAVPLAACCLPFCGLGLSRLVALLSPMAAQQQKDSHDGA